MLAYIWLIPLFPLLAFLANGFFGRKFIKHNAHAVSIVAILGSALFSTVAFIAVVRGATLHHNVYTWVFAGEFQASIGFQVDALTATMLMIVSIVATCVHIYSIGYMHGDDSYYRYFTYLSLFCFSMYMLVLANNYLMLYVFWEGVGLCSYLLIGFWFTNPAPPAAGKKAFLANRVGDFGFGLGVMMIFATLGTLDYSTVMANVPLISTSTATLITLLLFLGATGKSAQIPLYVWLPDAGEGPTPCSALIHAATMVTAGLYMIARSSALFNAAPFTLTLIATIGAMTALMAASIALVMKDIKKVLMYSTISQLGYMFLGLGSGNYTSGIFHLMTHAFFKALLFLGAGSVIHGMSGERNMFVMGGLKKHMPTTWWTMFAACVAIAGIPPFSGFWSKDEILASAFKSGNYIPWAMGCIAAFMTAFYMFRLLFLTFYGESRVDEHHMHHLHESPATMTRPMIFLAILALISGGVGISWPLENGFIHKFLGSVLANQHHGSLPVTLEFGLMGFSVLIAVAGILVAYLMYIKKSVSPEKVAGAMGPFYKLALNKYYVDEVYNFIFIRGLVLGGGKFLWDFDAIVLDGIVNGIRHLTIFIGNFSWNFDIWIVDGIVNGVREVILFVSYLSALVDGNIVDGLVNAVADGIGYLGKGYRKVQTGFVQNYMLIMALGFFVIIGAYFVIL